MKNRAAISGDCSAGYSIRRWRQWWGGIRRRQQWRRRESRAPVHTPRLRQQIIHILRPNILQAAKWRSLALVGGGRLQRAVRVRGEMIIRQTLRRKWRGII